MPWAHGMFASSNKVNISTKTRHGHGWTLRRFITTLELIFMTDHVEAVCTGERAWES